MAFIGSGGGGSSRLTGPPGTAGPRGAVGKAPTIKVPIPKVYTPPPFAGRGTAAGDTALANRAAIADPGPNILGNVLSFLSRLHAPNENIGGQGPTLSDVAKAPIGALDALQSLKLPGSGTSAAVVGANLTPEGETAKVISNLGKQIIGLPASTVKGTIELGAQLASDPGNTPSILENIVSHDPIVQSIRQGNLTPVENQPLNALLDVAGVTGLVGRAAGAVARSGLLGESVARSTALTSVGREVAPGIPGTAKLELSSPNLFRQIASKALNRIKPDLIEGPGGTKVAGAKADMELKQQVALHNAGETGQTQAMLHDSLKSLQKAKPKSSVEANVAPLLTAVGGGRDELQNILADLRREPQARSAATQATAARVADHLQAAIDKPNLDTGAIGKFATAYAKNQARIEEQQRAIGLMNTDEQFRALGNQAALQEPNVHYQPTPVTDPRWRQTVKDRASVVTQAQKDLQDAANERVALLGYKGKDGAYQGASRVLTDATKRLPVHYVNDALANHLIDLRDVIGPAKKAANAATRANIAEKTTALEQAQRDLLDIQQSPRKMQGAVIEDPNVPQLRGGPLKGMSVRPLTDAEREAIIAKRSQANSPLSYVSMINPNRTRIPSFEESLMGRSSPLAETGQAHYTGEAIRSGDIQPGYRMATISQANQIRTLGHVRNVRNFINRFADPEVYATEQASREAAQIYLDKTGIKMTPLKVGDVYRNIPSSALKEFQRQLKLDSPGKAARLLVTGPNRLFRETVLPMSPKLPVMHTVENITRAMLAEHGPVGLAAHGITDYLRNQRYRASLTPDDRARWDTLTAPGGLSQSITGTTSEDLGRLDSIDRGRLITAAKGVGNVYSRFARQIIRGQRALEVHAQRIVAGQSLREAQKFGVDLYDTNSMIQQYTDELAQGHVNPQLAEHAAQRMHALMGQYNAFPATVRTAWRAIPFGSWYSNAARLVWFGLPARHPLLDALLQDTNSMNAPAWNAQHQGLPADLQTSLHVGPSSWLDIAKLMPIGVQNNALQTVGGLIAPQWQGAIDALMGQDPFGSELKGPGQTKYTPTTKQYSPQGIKSNTGTQRAHAVISALEQIVEAFGGPLNNLSRAIEGGNSTFYSGSVPVLHALSGGLIGSAATKPGTASQQKGFLNLGPLDKILDPFRPTHYGDTTTTTGGVPGGSATL